MCGDHVKEAVESGCEHPEHHEAEAEDADRVVKELAVEAELALVDDGGREKYNKRDPDGHEAHDDRGEDTPTLHRCDPLLMGEVFACRYSGWVHCSELFAEACTSEQERVAKPCCDCEADQFEG